MKIHKIRYIITTKIYKPHNNQLIIINQYKRLGKAGEWKHASFTDGAICGETASRALRRAVCINYHLFICVHFGCLRAVHQNTVRVANACNWPVVKWSTSSLLGQCRHAPDLICALASLPRLRPPPRSRKRAQLFPAVHPPQPRAHQRELWWREEVNRGKWGTFILH